MPQWKAESNGQLNLVFVNEEDLLNFVNGVMIPCASQLGYELEVKKKSVSTSKTKSKDKSKLRVARV